MFRAPVWLYRARLGFVFGARFLLLVHRGRKTGRTRMNVLEVMEHKREAGEYVVMSGWGPKSQWYRNIHASPPAEVRIGFRRFTPAVRFLTDEEAAASLAVYRREHPILFRMLDVMLSWKHDGTQDDFRRIVADRPMVGLRPAAESAVTPITTTPREAEAS